ncbi:hypothetical protein ACFVOK_33280, partial [Streptomyces sp. NPDC057798]
MSAEASPEVAGAAPVESATPARQTGPDPPRHRSAAPGTPVCGRCRVSAEASPEVAGAAPVESATPAR